MEVQVSLWYMISSPSDIYLEVELLDHMIALYLIFWGTFVPFSTVAAPIYISTNSSQGFPFLHSLFSTSFPELISYLFYNSHSERYIK